MSNNILKILRRNSKLGILPSESYKKLYPNSSFEVFYNSLKPIDKGCLRYLENNTNTNVTEEKRKVIILDIIKYDINNGISLTDIIKLNFGITINEFFKIISNDKSLIEDIINIEKEKIILDYKEEIIDTIKLKRSDFDSQVQEYIFTDFDSQVQEYIFNNDKQDNEKEIHMRHISKTRVIDIDISKRVLNCLKNADIKTLGELIQYNRKDLLKFRNFGKKSLSELDVLLSNFISE